MPDVNVRVTKEFYWFLEWYKEKRGLNSKAAALAELAQMGLDLIKTDIPHAEDLKISPGGWGGYRHGDPKQQPPLYLTQNQPPEPPNPLDLDLGYADDIAPDI